MKISEVKSLDDFGDKMIHYYFSECLNFIPAVKDNDTNIILNGEDETCAAFQKLKIEYSLNDFLNKNYNYNSLIWFDILNKDDVQEVIMANFYEEDKKLEKVLSLPDLSRILLIAGVSSLNLFVIENFINDISLFPQFETVIAFINDFLSDDLNYSLNIDDADIFHLGFI